MAVNTVTRTRRLLAALAFTCASTTAAASAAGSGTFMDTIPVSVLFFSTVAFVLIALEMGYRAGRHFHARRADELETPVSAISGAVLGLVAFMLAFTFSIAAERLDTRRALVRDEANAIGTAYLRADFIPEPDRTEAKRLFADYVGLLLLTSQTATQDDEGNRRVVQTLAEAQRIQGRLWHIATEHAKRDLNSDVAALYIESLNELINLHHQRVAVALQTRIPVMIWAVLYAISLLGMAAMGYQVGIAGSRRSVASLVLALSFALVISLIVFLDNPRRGYVKVSQQPLVDVQRRISESHSS
jgi:hypothetical protein